MQVSADNSEAGTASLPLDLAIRIRTSFSRLEAAGLGMTEYD